MRKTIDVDLLARVEGEGGIRVQMEDDRVTSVAFRIFEPPRLFEGILRGRDPLEVPDLTARVCGICPVAYQLAAVLALEAAFGIAVAPEVKRLRRLLLGAEWISSHALHVFLLDGPDRFGVPDVFALGGDHPEMVEDALRLRRIGDRLMEAVGGRPVHPVGVGIGGFHRAPSPDAFRSLLDEIDAGREAIERQARALAAIELPPLERVLPFLALRPAEGYPLLGGRVVSTAGINLAPAAFEAVLDEHQVDRSTALHASVGKSRYATGPLARVNLAFDRLRPRARDLAEAIGLVPPITNPFAGILARCVEILDRLEEALELVTTYVPPEPLAEVRPTPGVGVGVVEAPRGVLLHRYRVDDSGRIQSARLVPPTSQNQAAIEADLASLGPELAALPLDEATRLAERAVRNHDPCISCATHAVVIERS